MADLNKHLLDSLLNKLIEGSITREQYESFVEATVKAFKKAELAVEKEERKRKKTKAISKGKEKEKEKEKVKEKEKEKEKDEIQYISKPKFSGIVNSSNVSEYVDVFESEMLTYFN